MKTVPCLAFSLFALAGAPLQAVITITHANTSDDPTREATFTWNGTAVVDSGPNANDFAPSGTPAGAATGDNFTLFFQPARNWVPGAAGTAADGDTYNTFVTTGFDGANVELNGVGDAIGINSNADGGVVNSDNDTGRISQIGESVIITITAASLAPDSELRFFGSSGYANFTGADDLDFALYDASANSIVYSTFTTGGASAQNLNGGDGYTVEAGDSFVFAASGDGADSWRLQGLVFDVVPEPTTPALFATAMIVFSVIRRNRRS